MRDLNDEYTDVCGPRAVVIGAGLGGLASAMRLAHAGWAVTVLDRLAAPGGRATAITSRGHRFDLGPTIVTAPDLFRGLWSDCGLDFDADVDLRPVDPFYEIRWPDGSSIRPTQDDAAMEAAVAALSPGDVAGWRRFMRAAKDRHRVGYEGMLTRPMHAFSETLKVLPQFAALRADRSIHGMVKRYVKDERLRMALSFHPLFIGGDPTKVTSMYALVSHLEAVGGIHYVMGGVGALARAMAAAVERMGGTVRQGVDVDEVLQDGAGRARGVRLAGGEVVRSEIVVSNADPFHTYTKLLPQGRRRRWSQRRVARSKLSMGLFVWYFGTQGTRGMWPDAGQHTILAGPRYEGLLADVFRRGVLAEDMSLYIHRPSVIDPGCAPEGGDTFYALSPVPHLGHDDPVRWAEMAETYRAKVQAVLEERLLPGLGGHVRASMVMTPEDFRDRYLSPMGAGFSVEPRLLQSAWFRPHNVSEEMDGLYLVGAGTHPGAGMPGVLASAEVLMKVVPPVETVVRRSAAPMREAAE